LRQIEDIWGLYSSFLCCMSPLLFMISGFLRPSVLIYLHSLRLPPPLNFGPPAPTSNNLSLFTNPCFCESISLLTAQVCLRFLLTPPLPFYSFFFSFSLPTSFSPSLTLPRFSPSLFLRYPALSSLPVLSPSRPSPFYASSSSPPGASRPFL